MEASDMVVILTELSDWTWDSHYSLAKRSRKTRKRTQKQTPPIARTVDGFRRHQMYCLRCNHPANTKELNSTGIREFLSSCVSSLRRSRCHGVYILISRAATSTRTNLKKQLWSAGCREVAVDWAKLMIRPHQDSR